MKMNFTQQPEPSVRAEKRGCRAFSLLEVMIAIGIFFMAVFAILSLVSQ